MSKDNEIQQLLSHQQTADEQMKIVIRELRMMAEGIDRYSAFRGVSEWTRNIWYAAAEMLEQQSDRLLH